ncbi:BLUF domain-containing protein [Sphingomonas glacialis]|uniref:BLUF domain-containing protein n=1 Tax=Sphingomonas glacialis TaxID=658225 RepID=A0A502G333_9SPHN|nr:BLUF domain-containing protein [Sphingomonas glacialis]TPG56357.1 BLUF domain-containing protein [Sphingomonas glacialis]
MTNHLKAATRDCRVRRVIYSSVAVGDDRKEDRVEILRVSRANNGLDGVSGFLWTDGLSYIQVLEGNPETVTLLLTRIAADPRHRDVRILSDQIDGKKAFSDWAMGSLTSDRDGAVLREQVARFLRHAPDDVRTVFGPLVANG